MTVFCVHSVIDQPQTGTSSVVRQGMRYGVMDRPSRIKSHPAVSLSSSQPGGPPCWASPLAFCLVGSHFPSCIHTLKGRRNGGRGVRHNSPLSGFLFLPTSDQIPMGPAIGRETKHRGWASHAVGLCITGCGGPTVQYIALL